MHPDEEMGRRMSAEVQMNLNRKASYLDMIMDIAESHPVDAAEMLCTGLMRGNKDTLQLGYDLGAAMIATLERIPLDTKQIGVLLNRVAVPKPGIVDYGPTR